MTHGRGTTAESMLPLYGALDLPALAAIQSSIMTRPPTRVMTGG